MPGIAVPIVQWVQTIKVDIHQVLVLHRKVLVHRCKTACICSELQLFHNVVSSRVKLSQTTSPKEHQEIQELLSLIKLLFNLFTSLGKPTYLSTVLNNSTTYISDFLNDFRVKFNKLVIGLKLAVIDPLPINDSQMVIDDIADCNELLERLKNCEEEGSVPEGKIDLLEEKISEYEELLSRYNHDEDEMKKSNASRVRIISQEEIDKGLSNLKDHIFRHSDFELKKIIGHGGFASVYWSYQFVKNKSNRIVAVKKLKANHFTQYAFEMYKREIQILSDTQHPAILNFIGIVPRPPFYIVTEFMEGGCLYQRLHAREPLRDPTKLTIIALGVAYALRFLHSKNIIHRDLKSLNVLLDANDFPKVCDFGMSRRIPENGELMSGSIGTAQWMAPEVMRSERYTEKADVYSYGILLWELLTGDVPFKQMRDVQVTLAVLSNNARPLLPTNASPRIAKLIRICWSSVPEDRPDFETIVRMFESGELNFPGAREDEILAYRATFRDANAGDAESVPSDISLNTFDDVLKRALSEDVDVVLTAVDQLAAISANKQWDDVTQKKLVPSMIQILKANDDPRVASECFAIISNILESAVLKQKMEEEPQRQIVLDSFARFGTTATRDGIRIVSAMVDMGCEVTGECVARLGPFLAVSDLDVRKATAILLCRVLRKDISGEQRLAAVVHNVLLNAFPETHPSLLVPILQLIDLLCDHEPSLNALRVVSDGPKRILKLSESKDDSIATFALELFQRVMAGTAPSQDLSLLILRQFVSLSSRSDAIVQPALGVLAVVLRSQSAYKLIAANDELFTSLGKCIKSENEIIAVFALKILAATMLNKLSFPTASKLVSVAADRMESESIPVVRLSTYCLILYIEGSTKLPKSVFRKSTAKYLQKSLMTKKSPHTVDALRLCGVISQSIEGVALLNKIGILSFICAQVLSKDNEISRYATITVTAVAVQYPFETSLIKCLSRMLDMLSRGEMEPYPKMFIAAVSSTKDCAELIAKKADILLHYLHGDPEIYLTIQNISAYPPAILSMIKKCPEIILEILETLNENNAAYAIEIISLLSHSHDCKKLMSEAGVSKRLVEKLNTMDLSSPMRPGLLLIIGRLSCSELLMVS